MAQQTAKGSGSTNNNGGTVINGGNFDANGPITNGLAVRTLSDGRGYGSKVIIASGTADDFTDPKGVIAAKPGGAGGFAYQPNHRDGERNFIIRAAGTQSAGKINGDNTNFLNTPGSEYAGIPRGTANTVTGTQRLGNPTWTYPVLPGSGRTPGLNRDENTGVSYNFVATTGNVAATDKAISGTRAVPGEVTYRTGAPLAQTTNFKARDSAEQ